MIQINTDQAHSRYSQRQELAADGVGFDLAVKRYGHAGGVTDFFRRHAKEDTSWIRWLRFNSHPDAQARVAALERRMVDHHIPVQPLIRWSNPLPHEPHIPPSKKPIES